MKELLRKGHKTVARYMQKAGYQLNVCYEVENGYVAEYFKTCAGITTKAVTVYFNENWKCIKVS